MRDTIVFLIIIAAFILGVCEGYKSGLKKTQDKNYRDLAVHTEMLVDTIGMQVEYEKSILRCNQKGNINEKNSG